jgi:hypothetical protein
MIARMDEPFKVLQNSNKKNARTLVRALT